MSRRSWLLMGLLAATWGASYFFIEVGLRDFSAPVVVCLRTALAALVLLPVALHRRAFAGLRGRWHLVAACGAVQVAAPFLLIVFGQRHIPSALTGIIVASAPLFTALITLRLATEHRSEGWALVGVGVGMLGVALLFGIDLRGDALALFGGALVLLGGLCYAIGALLLSRWLSGADPAGVAAGTMGVAALLALPAALVDLPEAAGTDAVLATAALGVVGTAAAFLVFYGLIATEGPARAGLVAYIAPGFAVVYGVVLLDESVTAGTVLGLGLILIGSYLGAEGRLPWRQRVVPVPS